MFPAWTTNAVWYDSAGCFDYQYATWDNGTSVLYDVDQANTNAWSYITTAYDTSSRVDYSFTSYRNGTSAYTDFDQAN